MNAKDIRELSTAEINKKIRDSQNELVALKVRKQVGQVENTAKIKHIRRDIARLQTIHAQKISAELASI